MTKQLKIWKLVVISPAEYHGEYFHLAASSRKGAFALIARMAEQGHGAAQRLARAVVEDEAHRYYLTITWRTGDRRAMPPFAHEDGTWRAWGGNSEEIYAKW